jgi:hypothetical protein
LKPAFFENEDLGQMGPWQRLLFIGLWCAADREGRLEDRPARLKAVLFPYDSMKPAELDAWLEELAAVGMVERYEAEGKRYIQVVNFAKHQHPHPNEAGSIIPPKNGRVNGHTKVDSPSYQGMKPDAPRPEALHTKVRRTRAGNREPVTESREPGTESGRDRAQARARDEHQDADSLPFESTPRPRPASETDQLATRLAPISTELRDDDPRASVTRATRIWQCSGLPFYRFDNVIRQAARIAVERRDELDRPMAWFFSRVEAEVTA